MSSLFAEAFLVPIAEPDGELPRYTYDERRAVNVFDGGEPVVEVAIAEMSTLTKIRTEREDRASLAMETITKVAREGSDRSVAPDAILGTETRQIPGEREDFLRNLDVGTNTAVRAEAEDFARDAVNMPQASVAW